MREAQNIRVVERLLFQASSSKNKEKGELPLMGFIFFEKSSRNVVEVPSYLPMQIGRVGVFVNPTEEFVVKKVNEFGLSHVQLHGSESRSFCRTLKGLNNPFTNQPIKILKALSIGEIEDLEKAEIYDHPSLIDYFVFDTKCSGYGGSGMQFDWQILENYKGTTPFLLSGGIKPDDASALASFHHKRLVGYDINSKFEIQPALKDAEKLESFFNALKKQQLI